MTEDVSIAGLQKGVEQMHGVHATFVEVDERHKASLSRRGGQQLLTAPGGQLLTTLEPANIERR